MVRILIKNGERYILCETKGLEFITRFSDEKCQYEDILKSTEHAQMLMNDIRDIYDSYSDKTLGYDEICEYMTTMDYRDRYFEGMGRLRFDMRSEDEISAYTEEATDKVWLMRNYDIRDKRPAYECSRKGAERILKTYDDIPDDGYDTWECGYWNGIMSALRWVMGDEKDNLDT